VAGSAATEIGERVDKAATPEDMLLFAGAILALATSAENQVVTA
jgi:hypothetical protein